MRYVIADIEATGLGNERQMIELALITWEDGRILDVYETLINPLIPIPKNIIELTGINQREVDVAPKFYEIADKVASILNGNVFVSHNVEFDFAMIQKAYEEMGKPLKCKTLCTLKLSQEMIPGLKSYTLDELCRFFNIKNTDRHRALPDAQAAMKLFAELKELASTPRAEQKARYLPQHQALFKKLPRSAGVLYFKDATGTAFKIEAVADILLAAEEMLAVRPESRELLERCEELTFDVTGSELIAQFKRERFAPVKHQWMITIESDKLGEKFFHLKPFAHSPSAHWYFGDRREAEAFLKGLKRRLTADKFAWKEGGKSKQEILEHNRQVDLIASEASFPCENLLLWGPGREYDEWSYVLIREGRLYGFGHDKRPPEEVLSAPHTAVQKKTDKNLEMLAVRYLREHRERRLKKEQWRELKDIQC